LGAGGYLYRRSLGSRRYWDTSTAGASAAAGIGSSAFTLGPQSTGGGSSQSLFPNPNATPVPSILDSIGK